RLVEKGKLDVAGRSGLLGRLKPATSIEEGAASIDLCIEAVPEKMDLKVEVLSRVVAAAPAALIGTNTSSLSVTEIGARVGVAERTVGLHFFNPPPVME